MIAKGVQPYQPPYGRGSGRRSNADGIDEETDLPKEFWRVHRLRQLGIEVDSLPRFNDPALEGGQRDDRDVRGRGSSAEHGEDLPAIGPWQQQVEQNHVRRLGARTLDALETVHRRKHIEPALGEQDLDDGSRVWIIFDQQNQWRVRSPVP